MSMRKTTLIFAALIGVAGARICDAAEKPDENWSVQLSGAGGLADSSPADNTGIVGMSAEELANYSDAPQAADGDDEVPDDFVHNRRRFVIREMRFNADWDTDPTSLPALVDQFKRRTGLDAQALQPRKPMTFDDPEMKDWPIVFMTAHNAFTLSLKEVAGLRKYLDHGGFLFADDCLYGFPFGPALHGEMEKVYPDKTFKDIDPANPVIGMALKEKFAWTELNEVGLPTVLKANAFQYMEVDGHMGVIYTPPDLGCMWEISSPPTPSNPLGAGMHNMDDFPGLREAGYRMGINIIFYSMTH
jgi:hypothetical protein